MNQHSRRANFLKATSVSIEITPAAEPSIARGPRANRRRGSINLPVLLEDRSTNEECLTPRNSLTEFLKVGTKSDIDLASEKNGGKTQKRAHSACINRRRKDFDITSHLLQVPQKSSLKTKSLDNIHVQQAHVTFNLETEGDNSDSDSVSNSERSASPFDSIYRGDIPCGSPFFQQVMNEMQSESESSKSESGESSDADERGNENEVEEEDRKVKQKPKRKSLRSRTFQRNIARQMALHS